MTINLNKVSKEVVAHFKQHFKLELDQINYGYLRVFEDDVDSEEYLIQIYKGDDHLGEHVTTFHERYAGQDYIVLLVDPMD